MRSSADAPSAPRRTDFVESNRQKDWKARLRCEAAANVSLIKEADPARRLVLERRASGSEDEITDLDRDDPPPRLRIERLKQP